MCGIAAIFSYAESAPPVDETELLKIREAMVRRGPDGAGLWVSADRRVGLAHRRLALVDLSETGAQPMADASGTLRIVYNGEIYNYRELRRDLESAGVRFRSTSDTEVLLHLYAARGVAMFDRLRGMYAFALWDAAAGRLLLARDPFGMKPLYYADDGRTIRVASQVRAILDGGAVRRRPDAAAQVGFFLLGYVPEPWTVCEEIKALPAGHYLAIEAGGRRDLVEFESIRDELEKIDGELERASEQPQTAACVRDALADSVSQHLIADVPVGLFLSAGLDSGAIAALAARDGGSRIDSITLGFNEYADRLADETTGAAAVAAMLGLQHHTRWLSAEDFESRRTRLFEAMDQPSTDGANTYFVSEAAHALGFKAALSGVGGDELFGGYSSYRQMPRLVNLGNLLAGKSIGAPLRRMFAPVVSRFTSPKYASILEYSGGFGAAYLLRRAMFMPWELESILEPEVVKQGLGDLDLVNRMEQCVAGIENDHLKVTALEMTFYMRNQLLRDADWAAMAHSLEIRMPMVDLPVLQAIMPAVATHPEMKKRGFLSLALRGAIPDSTLGRTKTGFNVPIRNWLMNTSAERQERGLRGWSRLIGERFDFALRTHVG